MQGVRGSSPLSSTANPQVRGGVPAREAGAPKAQAATRATHSVLSPRRMIAVVPLMRGDGHQDVPLVIRRSRSTPMRISGGTGPSIGATSGRLTRRKLAVRQPFDTTRREKPVPVEHLVEFTSAVSVAPPQRSKDWSSSCGCEDAVEILQRQGIEGDGENLVHLHGGGEGGHVDHLNEVHGRRKDPFELTDTHGTAPPEWQGAKTNDESHALSFCAGAHPPGGIVATVAWACAHSTAESTWTIRRSRHGPAGRRRGTRLRAGCPTRLGARIRAYPQGHVC
jgi:hypothetical protein